MKINGLIVIMKVNLTNVDTYTEIGHSAIIYFHGILSCNVMVGINLIDGVPASVDFGI